MKKRITLITLLALCAVTLFAQTVSVTFTGRDAQNQYLPLNRVIVSNLTKGWQETLIWPDTVLVMTSTGIGDVETQNFATLQLSQNNPNPFDGTTSANLNVAEQGDVELVLTDIAGRIVGANNYTPLQPGVHSLRITLSSPGLYFLTARQNERTASVKMVNRGYGGGNTIAFSSVVETLHAVSLPQPKNAHRGATDNPFDSGDQMEYVGYAIPNGEEVESGHVVQEQAASQTIVLSFDITQNCVVVDEKSCPSTPTVTDHEGNVYATVQIGQQCWMRDNLRTTTSPSTGTYLIPPAGNSYTYTGKQAFWYHNDSVTYAPMNYGLLYNWNAAVDTFNTEYEETSVNTNYSNLISVSFTGNRRGICPMGWHLPSNAEWTALTDYLKSQSEYVCNGNTYNIAKVLASTEGWSSHTGNCSVGNDLAANNATGFSAVPAGYSEGSSFSKAGFYTYFWSSTQNDIYTVWCRYLGYNGPDVGMYDATKCESFSVRCLRD